MKDNNEALSVALAGVRAALSELLSSSEEKDTRQKETDQALTTALNGVRAALAEVMSAGDDERKRSRGHALAVQDIVKAIEGLKLEVNNTAPAPTINLPEMQPTINLPAPGVVVERDAPWSHLRIQFQTNDDGDITGADVHRVA